MFWNRKSMFKNRMMKEKSEKNPIFSTPFLSHGTSRDGTGCQNPVPFRPLARFWPCPFVPGQGRNFCPSVPKSCTIRSRWKRYLKLEMNSLKIFNSLRQNSTFNIFIFHQIFKFHNGVHRAASCCWKLLPQSSHPSFYSSLNLGGFFSCLSQIYEKELRR